MKDSFHHGTCIPIAVHRQSQLRIRGGQKGSRNCELTRKVTDLISLDWEDSFFGNRPGNWTPDVQWTHLDALAIMI